MRTLEKLKYEIRKVTRIYFLNGDTRGRIYENQSIFLLGLGGQSVGNFKAHVQFLLFRLKEESERRNLQKIMEARV